MAGSMGQESNHPRVVEELAGSEVQSQKATWDKELLDLIDQALRDQVSKSVQEMKALAQAKDTSHENALAVVPLAIIAAEDVDVTPDKAERRRGRRTTTKIVGEIYVSFQIPEMCIQNNIDLDKLLLTQFGGETSDGNDARKFSVTERLENWYIQQRERGTGMRDVYYHHLTSKQTFRSKGEVVQFMLTETYPPKPIRKPSKVVDAAISNHDPSSASSASTERRERSSFEGEIELENQMTSDPEMMEFIIVSSRNMENYSFYWPR